MAYIMRVLILFAMFSVPDGCLGSSIPGTDAEPIWQPFRDANALGAAGELVRGLPSDQVGFLSLLWRMEITL